ncbi:MAG: UDP-N-acetylmuramoyl-L-alanine--D-glutamate ligase [Flavobacteriales bacterium]|nr:UDP-N-acetylmuramoyl-L-alanine--D-glutamate ligase [Flavobacteriales bacterium]MCB9166675.1 UDP-N-acetylmuramoyl-L-alanine--D-glutamate ligase [Flavobacteriales bacterium]
MKELVVLGAKESGMGAALLARRRGLEVFVSDAGKIGEDFRATLTTNGIPFEEGGHTADRVLSATEVVKSPGIPEVAPIMMELRRRGVPVIGEIELAARYTSSPIVAITGSNGKTTTTLLTYHILRNAGMDVGLGGNVGHSFARLVAERDHAHYVLELSSFQLDDIRDFRPHVAVLLNITPDHLDRYHHRMEDYVASKFRIAMNQNAGDHFVHNADDPVIAHALDHHTVNARRWPFSIVRDLPQGGCVHDDQLRINIDQTTFHMSMIELALQGKHNVYNSLAAGIAARILEVSKDVVRESMSDFQNIEHRLERVGTVNGVLFINDSKATNVNSAWYALESMDRPVVWVAGGVDKGNDYGELQDLVKQKVKAIICLGTDNKKLHKAFKGTIERMVDVNSADAAVRMGYDLAEPGDVVLLSPACASFDLFTNYEDRGRRFKAAVKAL